MLEFRNVAFSYRRGINVFDRLSVKFTGRSTALLGPNGAGKSTLFGLASTSLRPASGEIFLGDVSAKTSSGRRAFKRSVGWLPQDVESVSGLKVREQVAFAGWLKGLSKAESWESSAVAVERAGLTKFASRYSRDLSGGQLRRLGIAETLVFDAEVVLLDEPMAGLDPEQRSGLRRVIREVSENSRLVVSTHITDDLQELYDEVIVLSEGIIYYSGPVSEFLSIASDESDISRRAETAYVRLLSGQPVS